MKIFNYWFITRFYPVYLSFSLFLDLELALVFYNFLGLHFIFGLNNIFSDYIHVKKLKIFLIFLNRILAINLSLFLLESIF